MAASGKFEKCCATEFFHDQWQVLPGEVIPVRRRINADSLQILDKTYKDRQYSTTKSYCNGCIEHVKRHCLECGREKFLIEATETCVQTDSTKTASQHTQTDEDRIDVTEMTSAQREHIAFSLAKAESDAIAQDTQYIAKDFRNLDQLMKLDVECYIRKRNKVVLAFLNGISSNADSGEKALRCSALEQIYGLRNSKFVAPVSFTANLLQYQASQSKFCVTLNSKLQPAGSYKTMSDWLIGQGSEALPFPQLDCMVAFDNDQVIGKNWFVRADNKVNVSIVTSLCAAEFKSSHQFESNIHPKQWFNYDGFHEKLLQVRNKTGPQYESAYSVHYRELYANMNSVLKAVLLEQKACYCEGKFEDEIDRRIIKDPGINNIQCADCNRIFKKTKIKCDFCHVNLRQSQKRALEESSTLGDNTESQRKPKQRRPDQEIVFQKELDDSDKQSFAEPVILDTTKDEVYFSVLDPIPVNPNSYEAIKIVLRKIGKDAGIERYQSNLSESSNCRKWMFVMCDGLPYGIAHKLIHDTYYCTKCQDSVIGYETFKSHNIKKHNSEEVQIIQEFNWVVLLIGKGHFEMNMLKSFFELNWEPFLKHLAILMRFKTDKALNCAKLCRDNHKSWQLLKIFYFGAMYELLLPYVRDCIKNKRDASVEHYISWCKNCKSPSYMYMHEQVLTYCQALLNYRHGLRTKNYDLVFSGKEMFNNIFFGRPHPRYQHISMVETCDFFLYPPEIRSMVLKYCAFDTSVSGTKGEDLDFKLEAVNKRSKSWISGVPDFETWLRVFRNLDKLDNLKKSALQSFNITHYYSSESTEDDSEIHVDEIKEWRTFIRKHNYLSTPMAGESELTSVVGEPLDPDLIHFTERAKTLRQNYFDCIIGSGNLSQSCRLKRICVTKAERVSDESIVNHSNSEIFIKIDDMVRNINDPDMKVHFENCMCFVKNKPKDKLIELYNEVQSAFILESSEVVDDY